MILINAFLPYLDASVRMRTGERKSEAFVELFSLFFWGPKKVLGKANEMLFSTKQPHCVHQRCQSLNCRCHFREGEALHEKKGIMDNEVHPRMLFVRRNGREKQDLQGLLRKEGSWRLIWPFSQVSDKLSCNYSQTSSSSNLFYFMMFSKEVLSRILEKPCCGTFYIICIQGEFKFILFS